jgi:hypothetical protein
MAIVAAVAPPLWRDAEATTRGHVAQGSLIGLRVVEMTGDAGRLAGKLLVESGASVVRLGPAFGGPAMADPTVAARGGLLDWGFRKSNTGFLTDMRMYPWHARGWRREGCGRVPNAARRLASPPVTSVQVSPASGMGPLAP